MTEVNKRPQASLIVIYGRRRVGKTALVENAFKDQVLWKFEGLEGDPQNNQIKTFLRDLAFYSQNSTLKDQSITDWHDAFQLLQQEIQGKKIVIFFDEFQWLATMKSSFVSLFKSFWDNHFQKNPDCRFILCGSISSFMVKKVIRSKALYGRIDQEICLNPFTTYEVGEFFKGQRNFSEILQIQMILGGIPKYLHQLKADKSVIQNMDDLFFHQSGYFFNEYRRLFISHFGQSPVYETVIKTLAHKRQTADELAKACHTSLGGSFYERLEDLELAGFIEKVIPVGKKLNSKLIYFRINDEYLHFYFKFISPLSRQILSGQSRLGLLTQMKEYEIWQGLAFERFCRKNASLIAKHLGFSGVAYQCGSWFVRGTQKKQGAQVDLLFDRADKVLTICEIKNQKKLSAKKIIQNLETKVQLLEASYPRHSIQKNLILANKIKIPISLQKAFDHILFAEEIFS